MSATRCPVGVAHSGPGLCDLSLTGPSGLEAAAGPLTGLLLHKYPCALLEHSRLVCRWALSGPSPSGDGIQPSKSDSKLSSYSLWAMALTHPGRLHPHKPCVRRCYYESHITGEEAEVRRALSEWRNQGAKAGLMLQASLDLAFHTWSRWFFPFGLPTPCLPGVTRGWLL